MQSSTQSLYRLFAIVLFFFVSLSKVDAQWSYSVPITITNNVNTLVTNYQVPIYVNTSTPIAALQMLSNGNDIRFAKDCAGSTQYNYYIDSGMNSTVTKIWVKIDTLFPSSSRTIYFMYGNAAATAASTLNTFNGPYSSTNQVATGTAGGVANCQRGFRFSPNHLIIVSQFGKKEPTGTTRYVTIFNFTTQAIVQQAQVPGATTSYVYSNLGSPIWLQKNQQYLVELFQGTGDGYYFGTSSQINNNLTYYDMKYCNSCTQSTFPTNTLTNYHYGYPDFMFYTCDTNVIATAPTYVVGVGGGAGAIITSQPSSMSGCTNSGTVSCSVTATGGALVYQWQENTGSGFANISTGGVYTISSGSLSISNPPVTMNGYLYRCVISSSCGSPVISNTSTLTVTTGVSPTINTNPVNATACLSSGTSFTVSASGTGVTYQWQENTGSGFANITNGGVYSNTTTATLSLTGVTAGMNGYQYRSVVGATCATAVNSNAGVLTVNLAPAITVQPTNTTSCPAANATITVTATGSALVYQWQESTNGGLSFINLSNGGVYGGVNTNSLALTGTSVTMNNYQYRCFIVGGCTPSTTSNAILLTVNNSVTVSQQPQNILVCGGTNANFSLNASGSGLLYQWQVNSGSGFVNVSNGPSYSGATGTTLTVLAPPPTMDGYVYHCVITSSCTAPFNSSDAILNVNTPPVITTQPVSQTACAGTAVSFTVAAVGGGLVYQWQGSATGLGGPYVNLTSVQPYSGLLSNTLTLVGSPSTVNGYAFRCVVGGTCAPSVISTGALVTVLGLPTIVSQPTPSIICVGSNASFTVGATGASLVYQWQESSITLGYTNITNGGIYSGANTSTLVLTSPPASMNGTDYRCNISGTCSPAVITQTQTMLVRTPPTITGQPTDMSVCVGSNTSFIVQATAQVSSPVLYQWQVNDGQGFVNVINSAPYGGATTNILSITNANILMNGYSFRCITTSNCSPFATSSIVKLTVNTLPAVTNHPADVNLCPQSIASFTVAGTGTALVYRWQVNTGTGYTNIIDNTTYSGSNTNILKVLTAVTMNNYLYRCVLTGICPPAAISTGARLSVLNPVIIQTNTLTDTVCEGGTLKFGVAATGANLRYQWQRKLITGGYIDLQDLPPYSGVNTDSLRFSNAPDSIAGYSYRCRVYETQLCGLSFYTPDIPLGMNLAPQTNPAFLKVGPLKTATFAVPAGSNSYQWQVNKNNGAGYVDLTNSSPYSGTTTNTLFISPTQYTMNEYQFRCVIDGICKTPVASKRAVINIDPQLSVSSIGGKSAGVTVYPNPLEGTKLNISIGQPLKGNTEVKVMDKMGKVVYTSKLDYSKQLTNSIELNALAAGVYTLQVINESESVIESVRFTKQ